MAFDLDSFNNITSGAASGKRLWIYTSSTDTLATCVADDYLVTVGRALSVNDQIYVVGSDGAGWFYVDTASASSVVLGATVGNAHQRVTVSSAEMLALAATPKTLVPAPGAGRIVVFDYATLQLDYNSAAYAEPSSPDDMAIRYTNGSGVIVSSTITAANFVTATADSSTHSVAIKDAIVANSACENAALVLHNTGGEYTTGNSPVVVDIYYHVTVGV